MEKKDEKPVVRELAFADAIRIAYGCFDYSGGHVARHLEVYRHGIQTVINALEAAAELGLGDSQVAVLHRIGSKKILCPECGE